jgi:archaellum component FlaC
MEAAMSEAEAGRRLDALELKVTELEDAVDALQRGLEALREDLRALAGVVEDAGIAGGAG